MQIHANSNSVHDDAAWEVQKNVESINFVVVNFDILNEFSHETTHLIGHNLLF